jgi:DNA mismatch repair protein MLH3
MPKLWYFMMFSVFWTVPFSIRRPALWGYSMSSIRPLPAEVVAQIKSSIAITSLNGVVLELLKNSLDASASKLDVEIDYGRGNCTVLDNGLGIPPADFEPEGGLGKLHRS